VPAAAAARGVVCVRARFVAHVRIATREGWSSQSVADDLRDYLVPEAYSQNPLLCSVQGANLLLEKPDFKRGSLKGSLTTVCMRGKSN
jgi:hypothetical protein